MRLFRPSEKFSFYVCHTELLPSQKHLGPFLGGKVVKKISYEKISMGKIPKKERIETAIGK